MNRVNPSLPSMQAKQNWIELDRLQNLAALPDTEARVQGGDPDRSIAVDADAIPALLAGQVTETLRLDSSPCSRY